VGEVINLFTRDSVPAAQDSDFVGDFIDDHLGPLVLSVEELGRSQDEAEFRKWVQDIRDQITGWPE
jgi:hypothetical protein